MRRKRWGTALVVALAGLMGVLFLLPPSSATFTSQVNTPATIAASASFPGQPKLISDKGPVFYHRMEEAPAATTGSVAADTMSSSAGVYGPVTNSSSLWWRFDETATTAPFSDVSGSADTASINGTATAGGAGPMGGSVQLGSGSSLSSALSPFRAGYSFTMSVWVNIGSVVPSGSTRFGVLSMTGNSAGTPNGSGTYARSDAMIIADAPANCPVTSSPCWAFGMAGNPQNAAVAFDYTRSTTAVVANTWVNLTAVYDTSTSLMSLYVNGVLEGTPKAHTVPTGAATNSGLDVGRFRDTTWQGTTGGTTLIGETRTWRRAVTAADITQLVVRPNVRYGFTEAAGTSTTYTSAANSTGAPGAVSRSSALTTQSGASLVAGREGSAFWAGTNLGYIMGPNTQLNTASSFTVSAWVKLTDTTVDKTFFSANYGAGTVVSLGYVQSTNRWTMGVLSGLTTYPINSDVTTPVVTNQWVHLVGVHDDFNNLLRLYVDGVPQATVPFALTPATANGPTVVGAKQQLGIVTDTWSGYVDDLRLYSGYPLNSAATTTTTMQSFVNQLNPALSAETPGGLLGTKSGHAGSTAVAFGGTGNGYNGKYAVAAATTVFSVECLVRVAAGQSGIIAGLTSSATSLGNTTGDRYLYVDSAGKVRFGVLVAGSPVTVVSAASVDDGAWHHITASVGPILNAGTTLATGGLKLSLDGTMVSNSAVTAAVASTGYWRWGGAPMLPAANWPSSPNNLYLTGTLDEFAVYDKQLSDQDDLARIYGNY
ncbi:LamG domain-containing protein [Actinoplanes bogorensis]|uniref:LamG domain-containing protein n=1 Tax=Paractinoplanes bogorensis TaxID=1610840 RepID=A0ABS5YUF7_9ACTN|nr:LamG domain-containing protein [Actinoplanes bogorensis]MBU2666333.1 LamG domain-containing protein [Actinoplanes bogorensis]